MGMRFRRVVREGLLSIFGPNLGARPSGREMNLLDR
jgi:hypothetical protein